MERTRESYLTEACALIVDERLAPIAESAPSTAWVGYADDMRYRISVGFPKHSRSGKAIAQCFVREASTDEYNEIFVNPEIDDPIEVLGCAVHELIHAMDNCRSGHRNWFAYAARKVNLEGPLTATTPGPELREYLESVVKLLGPYPHQRMSIDRTHKKGGARMLKIECNECGFTGRTSAKWISLMPQPARCPVCDNASLVHPTV